MKRGAPDSRTDPREGIEERIRKMLMGGETCIVWYMTEEWKELKPLLIFEDLFIERPEGPYKGCSLLMALAQGADSDFEAIWHQFRDRINLGHIVDPNEFGVSILGCLANGAYNEASHHGRASRPFQLVWQRFGQDIKLTDLLVTNTHEGSFKGMCALWFLCRKYERFVVDKILPQKLGVIPEEILNFKATEGVFVSEKGLSINDMLDPKNLGLMLARNAGYELTASLNSTIDYKRKKHLRYALGWAIKVEDEATRFDLIEKIASVYVFNKPKEGMHHVVPADWLVVMNKSMGLDWCLDRLKNLETRESLKQEQKGLETELSELKTVTQDQQKKISALLPRH